MKKIIFAMILMVFLYGCTGANVETHMEAEEEIHSEEDETNVKADAGAEAELESLMGKMTALKMKVTYEITNPQTKEVSTMSQYMKGDRVRMDISAEDGETRIYSDTKQYNMCSNQDGWTCIAMDLKENEDSAAFEPIEVDYDSDAEANAAVSKDGSMQVAGTTAKCFRISTVGTANYARYCISNEGVLLYMKTVSDGETSEIKAKSYSTNVPDSDFNLPAGAKMQSMSDMMGIGAGASMDTSMGDGSCEQMCSIYADDNELFTECKASC